MKLLEVTSKAQRLEGSKRSRAIPIVITGNSPGCVGIAVFSAKRTDRFERFTIFKPPALPEVSDCGLLPWHLGRSGCTASFLFSFKVVGGI